MKKELTIHPSWLLAHIADNQFPPFLTNECVKAILEKHIVSIPSLFLKEIHLHPEDPVRRKYCNVYWPNLNRNEVAVYDGSKWVLMAYHDWSRKYYAWIYRCWKQWNNNDPSFLEKQHSFVEVYANKHEDKRWKDAESELRLALVSINRDCIKQLFHLR